MLVQPALITHLLCRPVSIADSMCPRKKLQVLGRGMRGVLRFNALIAFAANEKQMPGKLHYLLAIAQLNLRPDKPT
jgi:hypothetical protein